MSEATMEMRAQLALVRVAHLGQPARVIGDDRVGYLAELILHQRKDDCWAEVHFPDRSFLTAPIDSVILIGDDE